MLDLEFSPEQEMLRETVRGVCSFHCDLDVVRSLEDDPVGYSPQLWKQLSELDLVGLLVSEEFGGAGMGPLEGVVLYEELGRALVPVPHLESAVLCALAVEHAGSGDQQTTWLPKIASGEAIFTPAWLEPEGGFEPGGVQVRAVARDGGFVLSGIKRHVTFASAATRLVVLARVGDDPFDIDLFMVDPASDGVVLTQQLSLASDAQYQVELRDVFVESSSRIGPPASGWETWQSAMLRGVVLVAAAAIGGARVALDLVVQYAKDRFQFGKPLGAFQSIAHYLADATTAVDGGTTLVHEAAWAAATGRDKERLAPMAKLYACQTYRDVTAMAQQVFGGIGFTVEFDIQLFFRRAKSLQLMWWDPRYLEARVADAVLG